MNDEAKYLFADHEGRERRVRRSDLKRWLDEGLILPQQIVRDQTTGAASSVALLLNLADVPRESSYEAIADKIGFVPNVRTSDNVYQVKAFGVCWLACVVIGAVWGVATNPNGFGEGLINGAIPGALLGIVAALVVSGAMVGYRGLKR